MNKGTNKCLCCNKKIIKNNRHFCNRDCYNSYIFNNGSLNIYNKKRNERVCINCKKNFIISNKLPHKKFCSRECFLKLKNKNGWKKGVCLNCNQEILIYKCHNNKFCNNKCYHDYRRKHIKYFG